MIVTGAKAILGFVRFTRCYYLVVATETKPEGIIMGHVVYSITVGILLLVDNRTPRSFRFVLENRRRHRL